MIHWVSLTQLEAYFATAGQFWFTSYRDTSGTVALWALAYGVPCIGFNHQGSAVMLGEGRGILIQGANNQDRIAAWTGTALQIAEADELHDLPTRPFCSVHIEWAPKPRLVAKIMEI